MSSRITINGQEYGSVDEMPPEVRQQYEQAMSLLADRNQNGVPDILEGGRFTRVSTDDGAGHQTKVSSVVTQRFVINGKQYDRWEDVPAEVRTAMESAGLRPPPMMRAGTSSPQLISEDAPPRAVFTLKITRTTILTLIAAAAVTLLIAWLVRRG